MEALIAMVVGGMIGASLYANNHDHVIVEGETRGSRDVVEVPVYDNCDSWFQHDIERMGNMIVTRDYRTADQHLEGLNFFRRKYGETSFNVCYDSLVRTNVPTVVIPEPRGAYINGYTGEFVGEHDERTSYPVYYPTYEK